MALNDWQKTMRRSNVVKAMEEAGRQTGLHVNLVERVLKEFLTQGGHEGWLLSEGQIRKVQEADWQDDSGESRSYMVYTDPDRG